MNNANLDSVAPTILNQKVWTCWVNKFKGKIYFDCWHKNEIKFRIMLKNAINMSS